MPTTDETPGSNEWPRVIIRVPPELDQWLRSTADVAGLRLSQLCRLILIAAMRRGAQP